MNCQACGAEVNPESAFCHKCGESIGGGKFSSERVGGDDVPAQKPVSSTPAERLRDAGPSPGAADEEEEALWEGSYSAKAMLSAWIGGILLSAAAVVLAVVLSFTGFAILVAVIAIAVIWLFLLLYLAYRKLSVHYELTSQRFIHRTGILKRVTDRIEVIDMDDVTFEQGLIQRMVNVGKIRISSSDRSHPELVLEGIDDVEKIANTIDNVRRTERRRRGLHIEAI